VQEKIVTDEKGVNSYGQNHILGLKYKVKQADAPLIPQGILLSSLPMSQYM
jgi:hypothetical protein